jgi:hypothetical protein
MFFATPPQHIGDSPIVCKMQSTAMLYTSSISALSAAYAIYQGHYICSVIPASVFITSINYWRCPTYGWRRTLDVTFVMVGFIFMLVVAYYASHGSRFYIIAILATSCYPLSHYFHNNNQQYMGTLIHGYMHILANLGLIVMFSGDIPWLLENTQEASTLSN